MSKIALWGVRFLVTQALSTKDEDVPPMSADDLVKPFDSFEDLTEEYDELVKKEAEYMKKWIDERDEASPDPEGVLEERFWVKSIFVTAIEDNFTMSRIGMELEETVENGKPLIKCKVKDFRKNKINLDDYVLGRGAVELAEKIDLGKCSGVSLFPRNLKITITHRNDYLKYIRKRRVYKVKSVRVNLGEPAPFYLQCDFREMGANGDMEPAKIKAGSSKTVVCRLETDYSRQPRPEEKPEYAQNKWSLSLKEVMESAKQRRGSSYEAEEQKKSSHMSKEVKWVEDKYHVNLDDFMESTKSHVKSGGAILVDDFNKALFDFARGNGLGVRRHSLVDKDGKTSKIESDKLLSIVSPMHPVLAGCQLTENQWENLIKLKYFGTDNCLSQKVLEKIAKESKLEWERPPWRAKMEGRLVHIMDARKDKLKDAKKSEVQIQVGGKFFFWMKATDLHILFDSFFDVSYTKYIVTEKNTKCQGAILLKEECEKVAGCVKKSFHPNRFIPTKPKTIQNPECVWKSGVIEWRDASDNDRRVCKKDESAAYN